MLRKIFCLSLMSFCMAFATMLAQTHNGHEYVDLGLRVKWATCNVGASEPTDFGEYYAWGETQTKQNYGVSTYIWCNGDYSKMTKYCTNRDFGSVDNKKVLAPSDDVAHVKWGGNWRMPTSAEQEELCKKCKWTWTAINGVEGYSVVGPNGNSIFLPAAGYRINDEIQFSGWDGIFWSSSLYKNTPSFACCLYFYPGGMGHYNANLCKLRDLGLSVRPVFK